MKNVLTALVETVCVLPSAAMWLIREVGEAMKEKSFWVDCVQIAFSLAIVVILLVAAVLVITDYSLPAMGY